MIVLNMIVRNERHVISRCLRSALPFINQAVIVDTGSDDDTMEVISEELSEIQHYVLQRPWVDFGTNRTDAFQLAQKHCGQQGYALVMDADEELRPDPDFRMPELTEPVYGLWSTTPREGVYLRPQLLSLSHDFYWTGALHEQLECKQQIKGAMIDGLKCHGHFDSKRNKNPRKYLEDVKVLMKQPMTARNIFYLAQSWRDAGELHQAKVCYRQRIVLGGNMEEVWYSMFMVACLMEQLGYKQEDVVGAYMKAYQNRPSRAEPLRALASYWQRQGNETQCQLNHEVADQIDYPTSDVLFIDPSAYVKRFPAAMKRRER